MEIRGLQSAGDIRISIPLIKKDGSQATGVTLNTLSTVIRSPSGSTLIAGVDYIEATFAEIGGRGVYECLFPANAETKAFTLSDQKNPYTVILDSSEADVEPTPIAIWISSVLLGEMATQEAVLSRLASKLYAGGPTTSSVTVTDGTILSGNINDTKAIDQKYLKVQETGKFKIDLEFTGLLQTEICINFIYRYFGAGSSNHKVEGKMWNYTTASWVDILATDRDFPHGNADNQVRFAVPGNITDYFSGVSPNITAKVRIEHISNSDPAHQFWLEYAGFGELEQIYTAPDNTGILSMHEAIDSTTYGLAAMKGLIDNMQGDIGDPSVDTTNIYAQILAIKNYVDTLETSLIAHEAARTAMEFTLVAEHDATQAAVAAVALELAEHSGGTGANQITIQMYLTASTTPIADIGVQVLNANQSLVIANGLTNDLGQVTMALDDGTYKVRLHKSGYNFTVPETLIVTGNGTQIYYGGEIAIGAPLSANTCRVYEWCFMPDDTTPRATITAKANIIDLPYSLNGKLHAGDIINGTYDPVSGKAYWDIVYGARVTFKIPEMGLEVTKVVPSVTTKRLIEIT